MTNITNTCLNNNSLRRIYVYYLYQVVSNGKNLVTLKQLKYFMPLKVYELNVHH